MGPTNSSSPAATLPGIPKFWSGMTSVTALSIWPVRGFKNPSSLAIMPMADPCTPASWANVLNMKDFAWFAAASPNLPSRMLVRTDAGMFACLASSPMSSRVIAAPGDSLPCIRSPIVLTPLRRAPVPGGPNVLSMLGKYSVRNASVCIEANAWSTVCVPGSRPMSLPPNPALCSASNVSRSRPTVLIGWLLEAAMSISLRSSSTVIPRAVAANPRSAGSSVGPEDTYSSPRP